MRKHIFSNILAIASLLFISACGGGSETSDPVNSNADIRETAQEVTISFIQMNDLHANLTSHNEASIIGENENLLISKAGGLSRIASKVAEIRTANSNNILMNIGDTFHGGGEALFSNGNAIVDPVNLLNIDIGVPGNWDFAYGPVVTNARFGNLTHDDVQRPNYDLLAANATYRIPPQLESNRLAQNALQNLFNYTAGDPFLPATKIIERSGIKIGFIGITSDIVERMHPILAFNIEFLQGESEYLALISDSADQLRSDGANIVVVMSELGIQKDWALANLLDSGKVQVFFSAHTHEITQQALVSQSGALVVEAGNDSYLGQMDITFANGQMTATDWQLHYLDSNIAEDQTMLALVTQQRAPYVVDTPNLSIPSVSITSGPLADLIPSPNNQILAHGLDKVIYTSATPLHRYHSLQSDFNNFFTDLLRLDNQTDIAMTPGFRFSPVIIPSADNFSGDESDYVWQSENPEILSGEVSVKDVYRFFPAPYNLAKGDISIGGIKSVIEQNLEAVYSTEIFNQSGGWTDGFSGIDLILDLTETNGARVKSLSFSESQTIPEDDFVISVTGCARPFDQEAETTLCSYSGFENVTPLINPQTGEAYASADYFIDQLVSNSPILNQLIIRRNIVDESALAQWSSSEFVQPLEGAKVSE